MRSLIGVFVFLFIAPIWAAPADTERPAVYRHGEYVGVRAKHLGEGKESKNVNMHPAVVVAGPNHKNEYNVATISKNLPFSPPQKPLQDIHAGATLYGNIQLGGSRTVDHAHMKPWKDPKTGNTHVAMPPQSLAKLKTDMAPHANWKPPPQAVTSPKTPSPPPRKNSLPGPSNARGPAPPVRKNTINVPSNGKGPARPLPQRKGTAPAASGSRPGPLSQKSAPHRPQVQKASKPRMVKVKKPASKPGAKQVSKPAVKRVAKGIAKPALKVASKRIAKQVAKPAPKRVAKPVAKAPAKAKVRPGPARPASRPANKAKAVKAAPRKVARPAAAKAKPVHKATPKRAAAPRGRPAAKAAPKAAPRAKSPKRK